jgi:uncharacterized protein (PEP-CTERM system associated)
MLRGRNVAESEQGARLGSSAYQAFQLFVLWALLVGEGWTASVEIIPSLALEETYTDNVSLAPDSLKQSEWITVVIPAIAISADGARAHLDVNYAPEANFYARSHESNQIYQRLEAYGDVELARQLLFIDARANIDQYNVGLQGPITTTNVNTTGNLSTVKTFLASPYLRYELGSNIQGEARFTHTLVDSDTPQTLSSSVAGRAELRLNSGSASKLVTWDIAYSRETIDYELQQDLFTETIIANVRRLITSNVGVLAKAGYEHYESGAIEPATEGPAWGLGFEWTPTPRTRLAFVAGERLKDRAYFLDFSHRTRRTVWSASYKEEVTTSRTQFVIPITQSTAGYLDTLFLPQFADPAARQKAVDDFIARAGLPPSLSAPINFFSTDLFLSRRWHLTATGLGVRNVIIASVFDETRERLTGDLSTLGTGDFALSNNIKQTGTTLNWNWQITAQDAWNVSATYTLNQFQDIETVDHFLVFDVGYNRRLQPRISGSLNYRRQELNPEQGVGYKENAVIAAVTMRL